MHDCPRCEWIVDIHFRGDTTHLWTKKLDGATKHYALAYHPRIYITADFTDDELIQRPDEKQYRSNPTHPRGLRELAQLASSHPSVISVKFISTYLSSHYEQTSAAVELELYSVKHIKQVVVDLKAHRINMYNIDINPRQQFFIDTHSRPMVRAHITTRRRGIVRKFDDSRYYADYTIPKGTEEIVAITMHENLDLIDYPLPLLSAVEVELQVDKKAVFASIHDRLIGVTVRYSHYIDNELRLVSYHKFDGREHMILLKLVDIIAELDPDFFIISRGDKFAMEYLSYRARINNISSVFVLGRLDMPLYVRAREGQSYMSYGQILHRDAVVYLPGRIHVDSHNSFFFHDSSFEGLIELARISGIPPERVSRASIGTVLTGVEMLINATTIPPTLFSPIKAKGERFKTADHLLISDNGGMIFDAIPGLYTGIWAIDFTSLYPFIMRNHNISSETVLCEHDECRIPMVYHPSRFDDDRNYFGNRRKMARRAYQYDNIVPEVNYHICIRRVGIVTKTMSYVLLKRVMLKSMKRDMNRSRISRRRYKRLDSAMKWILVSCFGYLGFKNARWGSIESHQSVTAYARRYLLQAKLIANQMGYQVIGGITDSLFLKPTRPELDSQSSIDALCDRISELSGIPMDCEGRFQWIVFCNVKNYTRINALNRYFGYFDHDEFKLRGIRHRQRRVTLLEKEFQEEILDIFKGADTVDEFKKRIPMAEQILIVWKRRLHGGDMKPNMLIIKLKTGKGSTGYKARNTHQAIVARQYMEDGNTLEAGENMYYLVRDDRARGSLRVTIGPRVGDATTYDARWYCEMLKRAYLEILETPQRQLFGDVIYDGEPRYLGIDDWFDGDEVRGTRVSQRLYHEILDERNKPRRERGIPTSISDYF